MTANLSEDILLLIRGAVVRRHELTQIDRNSIPVLSDTSLPGIFFDASRVHSGLYAEAAVLEPRSVRGSELVIITESIESANGTLTTRSVNRPHASTDDPISSIDIELHGQPRASVRVAESGYLLLPDPWIRSALIHLYCDVLGLRRVDSARTVFELGGSSRDLQMLMLSINAVFCTRFDPREFLASSSVDSTCEALARPRAFEKSYLLQQIGPAHG